MTDAIPEIYPRYCFKLSPTISKWAPLRATDVHALNFVQDFAGQAIYFYKNHPLRWIRLTGIVLAVDTYGRKKVYTVDDSSGATIECVVAIRGPEAEDSNHGNPSIAQIPRPGGKLPTEATEPSPTNLRPGETVEVGTLLDIKGTIEALRGRQIKVNRFTILRTTAQEVQVWQKRNTFWDQFLSKPWVLDPGVRKQCFEEALQAYAPEYGRQTVSMAKKRGVPAYMGRGTTTGSVPVDKRPGSMSKKARTVPDMKYGAVQSGKCYVVPDTEQRKCDGKPHVPNRLSTIREPADYEPSRELAHPPEKKRAILSDAPSLEATTKGPKAPHQGKRRPSRPRFNLGNPNFLSSQSQVLAEPKAFPPDIAEARPELPRSLHADQGRRKATWYPADFGKGSRGDAALRELNATSTTEVPSKNTKPRPKMARYLADFGRTKSPDHPSLDPIPRKTQRRPTLHAGLVPDMQGERKSKETTAHSDPPLLEEDASKNVTRRCRRGMANFGSSGPGVTVSQHGEPVGHATGSTEVDVRRQSLQRVADMGCGKGAAGGGGSAAPLRVTSRHYQMAHRDPISGYGRANLGNGPYDKLAEQANKDTKTRRRVAHLADMGQSRMIPTAERPRLKGSNADTGS